MNIESEREGLHISKDVQLEDRDRTRGGVESRRPSQEQEYVTGVSPLMASERVMDVTIITPK